VNYVQVDLGDGSLETKTTRPQFRNTFGDLIHDGTRPGRIELKAV
jgi:hypothetical protein